MPQLPDQSTLHVNTPLTNVSIAYQQNQQDFVAASLFGNVPVAKQGDLYWKYDKGDWFRTTAGVRAPSTETPGSGWQVSTDSYFADVIGVHKDVDDQVRANADNAFNMDRDATLFVTRQLMLKREQDFISTFVAASTWGTDRVGVASGATGAQFNRWDASGSDPVGDIKLSMTNIQQATGYRPNALAVDIRVFDELTENTSILDRVRYGSGNADPARVSAQTIAALCGLERIVLMQAVQNTADFGVADSMSFISGKHALLCYANPTPSIMQPSAGYTFSWSGLLGNQSYSTRVKRYRMEQLASDRIEGEVAYDMKVVAPDLGVFFQGAIT